MKQQETNHFSVRGNTIRGLLGLLIVLFCVVIYATAQQGSSGAFVRAKRSIDPSKPMVALTFDDGPAEGATPRILDTLERYGAVATFFDVGQCVDAHSDITRREAELGCEIGSHTYRHLDLVSASAETIAEDRAACDAAFTNAIGRVPTLLRPPGGSIDRTVMDGSEQRFIGWSVDTLDWSSRDASAVIAAVQSAGNLDGQVVLMHSIYDSTADAVEVLVPWLLDQGYQLVTVTELFELGYGMEIEAHTYYAYDFFIQGRPDT